MKTSNYGLILLLSLIATLHGNFAHAQTAGNWNFNNTLAGTAGSNITVSSASFGPSIGSNSYNGEYFGQDGWPTGTLDLNAYLQFTLTPATSYYLVLNSVTLVLRRSTTGTAAGSGPTQWSLRSSLDGYTANISTGTLSNSYNTFTISLPASFQSLSSTITFRLYGYASVTTSGGSNRFVYDNISSQGQAIAGLLAVQNILLSAKADASGSIGLKWSASGFDAGTGFVVERSTDGSDFTDIYKVRSTDGNDATYQYEDISASPTAAIYYRVLAEGPDGGIYRSSVIIVNAGTTAALQIRGVVAGPSSLRAMMKIPGNGTYRLSVYSMDGKAVLKQGINGQSGDLAMDIPFGDYSHGIYILTLSDGSHNISRQFLY